MSKTLAVAQREVRAMFGSPVFWVLSAGFLFFFGYVFGVYVLGATGAPPEASMQPLLGLIGTIMLFVTPLLSMRLLADEQRMGTLEVLLTSPVHDWQVVAGKWLGALIAYAVMIAFTLFHTGIMWRLATNGMAVPPLAASYLGVLILGGALLALGTLMSALTESQVVAGFLGVMGVMVLWFISLAREVSDNPVMQAVGYAGLSDHYNNFLQGMIDTRDLVYFATLIVGCLYLAVRVLETRRWR
jgi:ABC-2 type transport system permease protein